MERPRWHNWVIALSILALAAIGVLAIWGEPLLRSETDDSAVVPGATPPRTGAGAETL